MTTTAIQSDPPPLFLLLAAAFVLAYGLGLFQGVTAGYDAGVERAGIIAKCPAYDSVLVSANPWRAADQQTRPPRILPAPECEP